MAHGVDLGSVSERYGGTALQAAQSQRRAGCVSLLSGQRRPARLTMPGLGELPPNADEAEAPRPSAAVPSAAEVQLRLATALREAEAERAAKEQERGESGLGSGQHSGGPRIRFRTPSRTPTASPYL